MLQFGVQHPEVLLNPPKGPGDFAAHQRLLNVWRQYLVFHAGDESLLSESLKKMPSELKKLWGEAIKAHFPIAYRPGVDLHGLTSKSALQYCYDNEISLLVIEPNSRTAFGFRGIEEERRHDGTTVSCLMSFDQSGFVKALHHQHQRDVFAETPTEQVLTDRFLPFVSTARHLRVVDRFLMRSLIEWNERNGTSGLEKLLKCLGQSKVLQQVWIYVSILDYKLIDEERFLKIIEGLRSKHMAESGVEIKLCILEDKRFRDYSHGRYVRADHRVLTIDIGLEVLCGDKVHRNTQMALSLNADDRRKIETQLDCRTLRWHTIKKSSAVTGPAAS